MAIKTYLLNGKKFYEVYVNGFDRSGTRVQSRRKAIESLRKAEVLPTSLTFMVAGLLWMVGQVASAFK